jgi:protein-S-isoprenylcysteine O-methyltransferase Ste14
LRFAPLLGIVLMIGAAFCWRPWLQYHRHGTWGVILFRSGRWGQHVRDAMLVAFTLVILAQAVIAAVSPGSVRPWLEGGFLMQVAGMACLFGGTVLLVVAQLQMGVSWRIGIDEGPAPGLVTGGLYRFCRNPIYVALLSVVLGYTLLLPTRLSVALLIGSIIAVWQQVRTEEAYLLRTYGEGYLEYARRVGRFLPFRLSSPALIALPIAIAFCVMGFVLLNEVMERSGFIAQAIAAVAFWPLLLFAWLYKNVRLPEIVAFPTAYVLEYLYVWGVVRLVVRQLRAYAAAGRPLRPGVRVTLTAIAYLGLLVVVGIVAIVFALLFGESHGGWLPYPLQPIAFILAFLMELILPVMGARAVWRCLERR